MKLRIIPASIFVLVLTLKIVSAESLSGNLKLEIENIRSNTGSVSVGLYNTRESYLSRGTIKPYQSTKALVKNNKAEIAFDHLPYGEYTIKYYHDVNDNGELDFNVLRIPKEPYGFSNNARGLGLPKYEKAKFQIDRKETVMQLTLG